MKVPRIGPLLPPVVLVLFASLGCESAPPAESSFYDERIDPILKVGCVQQTTGCHLADDRGVAVGNLDLSSFDALMRREDVLPAYGPYPVGLLLLKGGPPVEVQVETFDPPPGAPPEQRFVTVRTDIRHNAGTGIAFDSSGFARLQQWIEGGYTRNGVAPERRATSIGACNDSVGSAPGFDPAAAPADGASFDRFVSEVQPVLRETCAGGSCHGNPMVDLYLACGDSQEEQRWNYFVALSHLTAPASTSELLRRPLAYSRGGTFHEGGDVFLGTDEAAYRTLLAWAEDIEARRPDLLRPTTADEGLRFFANRVQPVLVRKGCMFLNCHSPAMFHDLRLRGGSQGHFSRIATMRNYEMSRLQLAIHSPDPNDSRIVAKNLFPPSQVPGAEGLTHRGGSLFEDFGLSGTTPNHATPDDCAGVDADGGDLDAIPAYCVLARWHQIERDAAIARGEIFANDRVVDSVVWVERPVGAGDVRDFDTFRGGARLLSAAATVNADGSIALGAATELNGACGLAASADIRRPAVSWDGARIAFAARASAGEPLRLYWMNDATGAGCAPIPGIAPPSPMENGVLTHDFDPAFAPGGRLVFASTRGNLDSEGFSYSGPTRTPAAMQPNANLYIADASGGSVRQLTWLLNQEVAPSFMADGRLIFTAEKREQDFHQLAGRRQNLDSADYHPLFAQRESVGFPAASFIVELANRNLAFVAGPIGGDGAGALAIVNRSIGPDQDDRDPADRFYLHSMSFPLGPPAAPAAVVRSPSALPTGWIVAACAGAADPAAGPFNFDLCQIDPHTGRSLPLGAGATANAEVDPVAVFARVDQGVFQSRIDEVNGSTRIASGERDAVVHVLDFPLLATLLFANTREGRRIDDRIGGFDVLEVLPPPMGATSFTDPAASGNVLMDAFGPVYVRYESLGHVPLYADGSAKFRVPGGVPILVRPTDGSGNALQFRDGDPFTGEMRQREQMLFVPGERANQSMPRRFFNGLCGGCHGSISGRELDVAVDVDALTGASRTLARDESPEDLTR